ncbi:MAG: hypothetical protein JWO36_6115 [Myxococcales bacterium]|nr:hypothetical protein [Myxococcales bacterium]
MKRACCLVIWLVGARLAHAQYNVPSQASGESRTQLIAGDTAPATSTSPSTETSVPIGWELGASLDFMTADLGPGARKVKFTDVVLFRLHGLVAIGKRLELFGGADLLPKQPSYTDELIWQGALLGARFRFGDTLSGYARAELGPNLGRDGHWLVGESAVQYKRDLAEQALFWESTLGATYTQLSLAPPITKRFWQTELLAQSGLAVRDKKGTLATWLLFTFHFPLVSRPTSANPDPTGRSIDPQTRVDVSLGMLIGISKSLDIFAEWSILDRGDVEDPRTTLPILSGGFDQQRILFGFNRRFGERRR